MSKTILFASSMKFHPNFGGSERVTDILARELVHRGYRVLYMYHEERANIPPFDYPAEAVFKMEDSASYEKLLLDQKVDVIIDQDAAFAASNCYFKIGNLARAKRIAVIHHNPALNYDSLAEQYFHPKDRLFFMRWFRIVARVILFPYLKIKYRNERVAQYRFLGENSDVVCLLSENFRSVLTRFAPQIPDNKVVAIANPNTYGKQQIDPSIGKSKQLLYVGRLIMNQKRPDRLFDIWRRLESEFPDWELVIVGDGVDREHIKRRAKGLTRVRFEGQQDPKSYYESASIFCMTSNHEGFPMVLSEAMVHGVVPIAFHSFAAATEIITDGENGFLITPFSIDDYTERLRELMRNETLRAEMAKRGMESVEKFDAKNIVDQWERLF